MLLLIKWTTTSLHYYNSNKSGFLGFKTFEYLLLIISTENNATIKLF